MTIINLRPVGWDGMSPRQWRVVREMVQTVRTVAECSLNITLMVRAEMFLISTEGYDV